MWQERTDTLNARPVFGRLLRLPSGMNDSNYLKDCVRLDYVHVWKIFKNMVLRGARDDAETTKVITFLPEQSFQLKLMSYR